jgi:hypothetical protein
MHSTPFLSTVDGGILPVFSGLHFSFFLCANSFTLVFSESSLTETLAVLQGPASMMLSLIPCSSKTGARACSHLRYLAQAGCSKHHAGVLYAMPSPSCLRSLSFAGTFHQDSVHGLAVSISPVGTVHRCVTAHLSSYSTEVTLRKEMTVLCVSRTLQCR